MRKWIKWELEIVLENSTLVPSKTIANDLSKIGKNVFTVPTFPINQEIKVMPKLKNHSNFS
jgi:hypothetical protein